MNRARVIILAAIAVVLAAGSYVVTLGPEPAAESGSTASQEGMSGMTGSADPECIRYDRIEAAWVCTATASGTEN